MGNKKRKLLWRQILDKGEDLKKYSWSWGCLQEMGTRAKEGKSRVSSLPPQEVGLY